MGSGALGGVKVVHQCERPESRRSSKRVSLAGILLGDGGPGGWDCRGSREGRVGGRDGVAGVHLPHPLYFAPFSELFFEARFFFVFLSLFFADS